MEEEKSSCRSQSVVVVVVVVFDGLAGYIYSKGFLLFLDGRRDDRILLVRAVSCTLRRLCLFGYDGD